MSGSALLRAAYLA